MKEENKTDFARGWEAWLLQRHVVPAAPDHRSLPIISIVSGVRRSDSHQQMLRDAKTGQGSQRGQLH